MKIATVSDIHSNIFALEAVLDDINRVGVDLQVNLGDILYGPIAPKATFDCLMEHEFITINGNQDRQIYQSTPQEIADNLTMQFILDDLGEEPIEWMRQLPFDHQLNDKVYLCHGTPDSDLVYLLEDVSTGSAELRSIEDIEGRLAGHQSELILCGHTHTPRTVFTDTQQLIVNPGRVLARIRVTPFLKKQNSVGMLIRSRLRMTTIEQRNVLSAYTDKIGWVF